MNNIKLAELVTTFFYIGKIKYAPGTFGSLAGYALALILFNLLYSFNIYFSVPYIAIVLAIFLFFIGTYFSTIYINYTGKEDPKEIVIDEVVGQLLTIFICSFALQFALGSLLEEKLILPFIIILLTAPFVLFRLFDILKPWPINWVDKNVKKGLGVMLDDVLAAIFAGVANYIMIYTKLYHPIAKVLFALGIK